MVFVSLCNPIQEIGSDSLVTQVDVIVPVFNTRLDYLADAIKSLRNQTFPDWCAWIVDDGSELEYGIRLQAHLQSYGDERIHYLYTEHKGATGSRNVAIRHGHAPYVAFLDSDDLWMPHHLSSHVSHLERAKEISLVHGFFEVIDSESQPMPSAPPWPGLNDLGNAECFVKMLKGNFIGASTVVLRRRILEDVGSFDASFPSLGDKELWLRLLNVNAKFHYDSKASALYRVHPGNISKNTDLLLATRRRIIEKAEVIIHGNPNFSEIEWPSLKRHMVRHMFREAAEVHFAEGRYDKAIKFAAPWRYGLSLRSCKIVLRSAVAVLLGIIVATTENASAFFGSRFGNH